MGWASDQSAGVARASVSRACICRPGSRDPQRPRGGASWQRFFLDSVPDQQTNLNSEEIAVPEHVKLNKSFTNYHGVYISSCRAPDEYQIFFKQDGAFLFSSIKMCTLEPSANWRFHLLTSPLLQKSEACGD